MNKLQTRLSCVIAVGLFFFIIGTINVMAKNASEKKIQAQFDLPDVEKFKEFRHLIIIRINDQHSFVFGVDQDFDWEGPAVQVDLPDGSSAELRSCTVLIREKTDATQGKQGKSERIEYSPTSKEED